MAFFRLWRCLRFFVDVSIPQFQQRTVEQTVYRSACGVVRSDRGRAHSPDSRACFGAGRRTDRRSGSAPDLRVQDLPTVAHRPAESVLLRFTELFHPLSSIWCFFHPGTGRTQVLTPLDGHYPFFMLHKRRCYFRCENSRQSILDAWTCLDFCEHTQARRVCLLCHGSASCVHGKRRRRFPDRVHLVKRRKKCSCDHWSVRSTHVTSWMSWEARTVLTCRGLNRRGNASEDLVEDVAFHLDPR